MPEKDIEEIKLKINELVRVFNRHEHGLLEDHTDAFGEEVKELRWSLT